MVDGEIIPDAHSAAPPVTHSHGSTTHAAAHPVAHPATHPAGHATSRH